MDDPTKHVNSRLNKNSAHLLWIGIGSLLMIATVTGFFAKWSWLADLIVNFRVQMAIVGMAIFIFGIAIWDSRKRTICRIGISAVIILLNAIPFGGYLFDTNTPIKSANATTVKVMTFNLLSSNREFEKVFDHINSESPDVLAVLEVGPEWGTRLEKLTTDYTSSKILARGDNFGIALLSRLPVKQFEVLFLDEFNIPAIRATIETPNGDIDFVAIHPLPPLQSKSFENRNKSLLLAAMMINQSTPRMMVGDFNMTPWSPHFKNVLDAGNLKDISVGYGIQPTWNIGPTMMGGLKIDHILTNPEIQVDLVRVGPSLGSDHRSVTASLFIPRAVDNP